MPTPVHKLKVSQVGKKVQRFTAWSYSRLSVYEECPRKAKYANLDKLPQPASPAMERGKAIHLLAEQYVKGQLKKLPPELKTFEHEFKAVRGSEMVEQQWAFDANWQPTGWFDPNCVIRVMIDLVHVGPDGLNKEGSVISAAIVDHKTGKLNDKHLDQLDLYALAAFAQLPDLQEAQPELWYLDQGVLLPDPDKPIVYKRSQMDALKKKWDKRAKPLLMDTIFAPRPGPACRWCPWTKAKGGPCEF